MWQQRNLNSSNSENKERSIFPQESIPNKRNSITPGYDGFPISQPKPDYVDSLAGKNDWSESELSCLFKLQKLLGNKWTKIARMFPTRTVDELKNQFYSTIRRNIRKYNKTNPDQITRSIKEILKDPELSEKVLDFSAEGIYKKRACVARKVTAVKKDDFSEYEWFIPGLVPFPMPPLHLISDQPMDELFNSLKETLDQLIK